LVRTWVCVDCLTYTTAFRFKTVGGRRSLPVIAVFLRWGDARCLHQKAGSARDGSPAIL